MMIPTVQIIETDDNGTLFNAETFLQYLNISNERWWSGNKFNTEPAWCFRGVTNATYNLLPSGLRPIDGYLKHGSSTEFTNSDVRVHERLHLYHAVKGVIDSYKAGGDTKLTNASDEEYKRFVWNSFICEGVTRFQNALFDAGYAIDKPMHSLLSDRKFYGIWFDHGHESRKHREHLKSWAWAQHHNIPTFLLDWTYNSACAAYFASENNMRDRIPQSQETDIAVWALNWKKWRAYRENKNDPVLDLAFDPHFIRVPTSDNPYIKAQSGVFTWIAGKHDEANDRWLGSDEILSEYTLENEADVFLKKIVLKAHDFNLINLRSQLKRMGITRYTLMPTLDNLAIAVRNQWL